MVLGILRRNKTPSIDVLIGKLEESGFYIERTTEPGNKDFYDVNYEGHDIGKFGLEFCGFYDVKRRLIYTLHGPVKRVDEFLDIVTKIGHDEFLPSTKSYVRARQMLYPHMPEVRTNPNEIILN